MINHRYKGGIIANHFTRQREVEKLARVLDASKKRRPLRTIEVRRREILKKLIKISTEA